MLTAEQEREWMESRGLSLVNDWKDAAKFEARVAQRLVQNMTWPCYASSCPEGKDKDIDYLICEKEEWCHMKHARLAVEEEIDKGEVK